VDGSVIDRAKAIWLVRPRSAHDPARGKEIGECGASRLTRRRYRNDRSGQARVTGDFDAAPVASSSMNGVKHRTNQYLTDVFDKTFFADWCYFLPARVTAWPRVSTGMRARHAA
jgi:hypothetical protein